MTTAGGSRRARKRAKAELRARLRRLRDALPAEERARRGKLIEERVASLPVFGEAASVLLFASFGSEVPTAGLVSRAHDAGKRVLLPYLAGEAIHAAEVGRGDALVATDYGPREPAARAPVDPAGIDLVVTPGLAFDRRGHRLGYGGGYFDRFLGRLRDDATAVGVAFGFQVVDEVPAGPADRAVDLVVTEGETIDCRADRRSRGSGLAPL